MTNENKVEIFSVEYSTTQEELESFSREFIKQQIYYAIEFEDFIKSRDIVIDKDMKLLESN